MRIFYDNQRFWTDISGLVIEDSNIKGLIGFRYESIPVVREIPIIISPNGELASMCGDVTDLCESQCEDGKYVIAIDNHGYRTVHHCNNDINFKFVERNRLNLLAVKLIGHERIESYIEEFK